MSLYMKRLTAEMATTTNGHKARESQHGFINIQYMIDPQNEA
jgi:hypothetical protein